MSDQENRSGLSHNAHKAAWLCGALCALFSGAALTATLGDMVFNRETFQQALAAARHNDHVGPVMATPDDFPMTRVGEDAIIYDKDKDTGIARLAGPLAPMFGSTRIYLSTMPHFEFVPDNEEGDKGEVVKAGQARQELDKAFSNIQRAAADKGIKPNDHGMFFVQPVLGVYK